LLKATLVGLAEICACCACRPVPVRAMVKGEPGKLFVIEMLPLAAPLTVGANVTVKDVVWPGFKLPGADHPVSVNPVPVMLCAVIETGAVPRFDRVTGTDPLLPTGRLVNAMLDGLAERLPCVPVPLKGIDSVGLVAVVASKMSPEASPVAVGANCAVKVAVDPAAILCPTVRPVELNPGPVVVI
jgi:hypothetical protein